MLDPQSKTLDGIDFNFLPMDPFVVARLEKKLAPVLLPVIGGLKALTLDADVSDAIDFEVMARGLREAITDLPDNEYEQMLKTVLGSVTATVPNVGAELCSQKGAAVFQGNTMLLYKVVIEAMRYNKFIPFALIEGGGAIKGIVSSLARTTVQPKSGLKLERSEP